MKHVLWISAGMLLAAASAELVVRQSTGQPHRRELLAATAITLVSAHLSILPLILLRRSGMVIVFQAAFAGTILHLFLTIALGGAVHAMRLVGDRNLFLFLLLGLYWVSLLLVVVAMNRIFRRASASAAAATRNPGETPQAAPTMR